MDNSSELKEVIALLKTLTENKASDTKRHRMEHEYLRILIDDHKIKKETSLAILRRVTSGSVWAILVGIMSAVAYSIKGWFGT